MKHTELQALQKRIKFDARSMAACIGIPYDTYRNYFYGYNQIPPNIGRKALEIEQINITFMQDLPERVDERIRREFPQGIQSCREVCE